MRAYEIPGFRTTFVAGEDLTDKRRLFGKINALGEIVTCGDGEQACGVIQFGEKKGEAIQTMVSGISFITLGDTVAAGAAVTSNASGQAVTTAVSKITNGICIVGGAAGDLGCILLK